MRLAPRYKHNNTKSSSKGMYYYYKRQNYSGDSYSKKVKMIQINISVKISPTTQYPFSNYTINNS